MKYSPQQELYDQIYIASEDLGFNTYDHLPMQTENAEYPFVIIGENQLIPLNLKTAIGGQLNQTIHVWGDEDMRFTVADILNQLVQLGYQTIQTEHFRFVGRIGRQDSQIMQDTSVPNTVLNHGILTLVFNLK